MWLPWAAVSLVIVLPVAASLAWRHAASGRPSCAPSWWAVLAGGAVGWVALSSLGLAYPAPPVSTDPDFLVRAVAQPAVACGRWYLALWSLQHLHALAGGAVAPVTLILVVNALFAVVALAALAGCAHRLALTRGEALAMTLLTWSAFGVLQLCVGYVDVYPIALAGVALYLWTALRAIAGAGHPVWPFLLVAVGPFWYVGLVLLAPSLLVVAGETLRRPGGGRRVGTAGAVALLAAGLATVPGYGVPFAWGAFAAHARRDALVVLGLSPTSSLLPLGYVLSAAHASEVLHTLLLVDGVGVLLALVCGGWLAIRGCPAGRDPELALLALVGLPYLAYVVAMDPLFGAFGDWDLFSYGAAATSLLGSCLFVRWGRGCPRAFAPLLGLALAAACVHLLARLGALDVGLARHLQESPPHLRPVVMP